MKLAPPTSDFAKQRPQPVARHMQKWLRWTMAALLLVSLIVVVVLLMTTDRGQEFVKDPHLLTLQGREFISHHRFIAPVVFLLLYVTLAVLCLPVWWLQILGGAVYGLYWGTFWSLVGGTVGAVVTVRLSRWLAADWFHNRIESRMDRLRKLDDTLGHNGFLVVMTVRLIHLLPFGLCNYALGLTKVSIIDVTIGTFLGSIPAVAVYNGSGAGYYPWRNWKFDLIVAGINALLLLPLLARYLRPQWFRKIGVE